MPRPYHRYQHTNINDDEIRLLILEPEGKGGRQSRLEAQLETFVLTVEKGAKQATLRPDTSPAKSGDITSTEDRNVQEAPQYDALSYTWGGDYDVTYSEDQLLHIFKLPCQPQNNEQPRPRTAGKDLGCMQLTENLAEALRTFRAELKEDSPPMLLWVDALCIQQDGNHCEKATQIGKMADIYTEAERVRVWLGHGQDAFADVRDFIKRILSLEKFDEMARGDENAGKWRDLICLMQTEWFRRRWTVQELAFARNATVHWGSNVIPWNEFASAIQLFASKGDTIRRALQKSRETHYNPDYIGEIEAYSAKNLVDTIDKMFRKSDDGNIMESLLSLETILTTMTAFEVSKPHDVVYAIIQLSKDARPAHEHTLLPTRKPTLRDQNAQEPRSSELKQTPEISEPSLQDSQRLTESPERFNDRFREGQDAGQTILDSSTEWADTRGRTQARSSPAGTHLAVRNDIHRRSRSRGLSPAAARTIAERNYRKPRHKFFVDYNKSILDLCTEVTNFVVNESKSLDIICKPWAPDLDHTYRQGSEHKEDQDPYPSWIRPVGKRSFCIEQSIGFLKSERTGPDNLAGTQHQGSKPYSASGIVPPERPNDTPLIEGRILNARGFILDRIDKIAEPALDATIPSRWLVLGWPDKRKPSVESMPPEQFWRSLVANRRSSNAPTGPPLYWRQACQWAFSRKSCDKNLNTAELIHNLSNTNAVSKPVREFVQRVRAVVWDRALIRTASTNDASDPGFLGLAPKEAQKDDLVCILYGCSVPVVLRRKVRRERSTERRSFRPPQRKRTVYGKNLDSDFGGHSRSSSMSSTSYSGTSVDRQSLDSFAEINLSDVEHPKDEEYSLIGECYIHGMMDGEAFSQLEKYDRSEKERTFRIGCAFDCTCRRCEPGQ